MVVLYVNEVFYMHIVITKFYKSYFLEICKISLMCEKVS